jgi:hypothetical protein
MRLYTQAGLRLAGGNFYWSPIVFQKPPVGDLRVAWRKRMEIRLGGVIQAIGRINAWPSAWVHWVRQMNNQPFDSPGKTSETA